MSKVVIIGGGPVGMSLALALHRQGVPSEIHDMRPRSATAGAIGDQRILALSHGSQQTLARLGVWQDVRATPITDIHVSQRGGAGRTRIAARDEGVAALGHVTSSGSLSAALDKALTAADIPYIGESKLLDVTPQSAGIALDFSNGRTTAPLVAYAEGRIEGAPNVVERDYDQHALICQLTSAEPHNGTAWERFTPHGPFALLPYENVYAAVYTCTPLQAEILIAMTDAELLDFLQREFGPRVRFTRVQNRFVYPLGLRYRREPTSLRQAWLGNAAQTLHPVAGQGFNLALRDCVALAEALTGQPDPGAAPVLARYAAGRRLDRYGTIGVTDGLIRLFSNDNPILRHLRGAGLLGLDLFPPARHFLARRMMFGARAW